MKELKIHSKLQEKNINNNFRIRQTIKSVQWGVCAFLLTLKHFTSVEYVLAIDHAHSNYSACANLSHVKNGILLCTTLQANGQKKVQCRALLLDWYLILHRCMYFSHWFFYQVHTWSKSGSHKTPAEFVRKVLFKNGRLKAITSKNTIHQSTIIKLIVLDVLLLVRCRHCRELLLPSI